MIFRPARWATRHLFPENRQPAALLRWSPACAAFRSCRRRRPALPDFERRAQTMERAIRRPRGRSVVPAAGAVKFGAFRPRAQTCPPHPRRSPLSGQPTHVTNFIRNIIEQDLATGKYASRTWAGRPGPASVQQGAPKDPARIRTRFPPEPNGYLHIGHAKSICLNFGVAQEYGGVCHMRFDDTNPVTEETEYVDSILDAVHWLGFDWGEHLYYASDYFDYLYQFAEAFIQHGLAYVDELTADEMREFRGTLTEAGRTRPWRDRPTEREPGSVPPHARGRVPRRQVRAAAQDRHDLAQHQPARPRGLPHPPRAPPPHRRQVVHLSELRLHPRRVRRAGEHHAFAVHAGVRGSSSAVQLAQRAAGRLRHSASSRCRSRSSSRGSI